MSNANEGKDLSSIFTEEELEAIKRIEYIEDRYGENINYITLCLYLGVLSLQKKRLIDQDISKEMLSSHFQPAFSQALSDKAGALLDQVRKPGKFQWKRAISAGFIAGYLRYISTGLILGVIYLWIMAGSMNNGNSEFWPHLLRSLATSLETELSTGKKMPEQIR